MAYELTADDVMTRVNKTLAVHAARNLDPAALEAILTTVSKLSTSGRR